MSRAFLVITIGSLLATSALATTYVRVEKDGTKTYSDRPLPGGQQIDVQPAQTYSAPPVSTTDSSRPREVQELMDAANFRYTICSLSPTNNETFTNPQSVVVALSLTPPLRSGDEPKISVDGAVVNGGGALNGTVEMPDRGSHTVSAQVMDRSGKSVCDTTSTFYVQRSNLNSPTRIPPRPPPRPTPH
jgi:hypothetical protein